MVPLLSKALPEQVWAGLKGGAAAGMLVMLLLVPLLVGPCCLIMQARPARSSAWGVQTWGARSATCRYAPCHLTS